MHLEVFVAKRADRELSAVDGGVLRPFRRLAVALEKTDNILTDGELDVLLRVPGNLHV